MTIWKSLKVSLAYLIHVQYSLEGKKKYIVSVLSSKQKIQIQPLRSPMVTSITFCKVDGTLLIPKVIPLSWKRPKDRENSPLGPSAVHVCLALPTTTVSVGEGSPIFFKQQVNICAIYSVQFCVIDKHFLFIQGIRTNGENHAEDKGLMISIPNILSVISISCMDSVRLLLNRHILVDKEYPVYQGTLDSVLSKNDLSFVLLFSDATQRDVLG